MSRASRSTNTRLRVRHAQVAVIPVLQAAHREQARVSSCAELPETASTVPSVARCPSLALRHGLTRGTSFVSCRVIHTAATMPAEVSSKSRNWGLERLPRGEEVFLFGEQAEHKAGETGATSEAGKRVRGVKWAIQREEQVLHSIPLLPTRDWKLRVGDSMRLTGWNCLRAAAPSTWPAHRSPPGANGSMTPLET